MAALPHPRAEIKAYLELVFVARLERPGMPARVALRAADTMAGDGSRLAIRCNVFESYEPVGQRGAGRDAKVDLRSSEHGEWLLEGGTIVAETVGIRRPLIGQQLAPPQSCHWACGWHVTQLVDHCGDRMIGKYVIRG